MNAPPMYTRVRANASATDSAAFTATFVCDRDGPLTSQATDR